MTTNNPNETPLGCYFSLERVQELIEERNKQLLFGPQSYEVNVRRKELEKLKEWFIKAAKESR